jgi:hypothetical protein
VPAVKALPRLVKRGAFSGAATVEIENGRILQEKDRLKRERGERPSDTAASDWGNFMQLDRHLPE